MQVEVAPCPLGRLQLQLLLKVIGCSQPKRHSRGWSCTCSEGWTHRANPPVAERSRVSPVTLPIIRTWYSSPASVDASYVMCLLQSEALFNSGVQMISHFQLESYYLKILEGKSDGVVCVEGEWRQRKPRHRRRMLADGYDPTADAAASAVSRDPNEHLDPTTIAPKVASARPGLRIKVESHQDDDGEKVRKPQCLVQ